MNKAAIKNFAIWARNKLIADVSYDARLIGITEDCIAKPLPQSFGGTQFFDIGTAEPYSIPARPCASVINWWRLFSRRKRIPTTKLHISM